MGEHSGWLTKLRPEREEGLGGRGRCLEVKGTRTVVWQSVQSAMTLLARRAKSRSPSRGTLRFSGTPSSEPFLPS